MIWRWRMWFLCPTERDIQKWIKVYKKIFKSKVHGDRWDESWGCDFCVPLREGLESIWERERERRRETNAASLSTTSYQKYENTFTYFFPQLPTTHHQHVILHFALWGLKFWHYMVNFPVFSSYCLQYLTFICNISLLFAIFHLYFVSV